MAEQETKRDEQPESIIKHTIKEITQPFKDLFKAPRALWGLNLSYLLEGFTYFGVLTLLTMFFNDYVGLNDIHAGQMVGVLTGGITLSMLFLGGTVDMIGVRKSLLIALSLMLVGRVALAFSPQTAGTGLWSTPHLIAMGGIFGIILGYGIYQPASYAAVKQFTSKKTAAMGYAMLYAIMNLGGFLPAFTSPIRKNFGIDGMYWVYSVLTVVGLLVVAIIITKKAIKEAKEKAKKENRDLEGKGEETAEEKAEEERFMVTAEQMSAGTYVKLSIFGALLAIATAALLFIVRDDTWGGEIVNITYGFGVLGIIMILWGIIGIRIRNWLAEKKEPIDNKKLYYFANFPISDARFIFFIFILIPVQTLFAHNWLTLPLYFERAFTGIVSEDFEIFVNLNPILIFILAPMVTALTSKKNTYNMMILGTFIMAAPTFILASGPSIWAVFGYLLIMTIGEAMWQPRFLQWVAEIAPKGMTGIYMGIGQFPWFMTKVITSLYSGWFLMKYANEKLPPEKMDTETMWVIYGFIAIVTPIALFFAKGWMKKGFKEKAEEQ